MDRPYLSWLRPSFLLFGLVCAIAGGASAYIVSAQQPKVYEAKALLIAQTMGDTFAEVAVSRPLLQAVVDQLDLQTDPDALGAQIEARPSRTSALLTVVARDPNASRAAAIANAVADQLVQRAPDISGSSPDTQRSIMDDLASLRAEIARNEAASAALAAKSSPTASERQQLELLQSQLGVLRSIQASLLEVGVTYSKTLLTNLAPAEPPAQPASPQPALAAALAAVLGLAVGLGSLLSLRFVDERLRSPRTAKVSN